jgi:phenylacetate-CoA ligase
MKRGRCECGRTHARFTPVGRSADEMVVQGRSVLPMDVWGAIEDVPASEHGLFQIVRPRREMDSLKIRVGYAGKPDLPQVRDALVDVGRGRRRLARRDRAGARGADHAVGLASQDSAHGEA